MLYNYKETSEGTYARLEPQSEEDQEFLKILARKETATIGHVQGLILIGTGWNDRGPRNEIKDLVLTLK
jgi:hypothetical protein